MVIRASKSPVRNAITTVVLVILPRFHKYPRFPKSFLLLSLISRILYWIFGEIYDVSTFPKPKSMKENAKIKKLTPLLNLLAPK